MRVIIAVILIAILSSVIFSQIKGGEDLVLTGDVNHIVVEHNKNRNEFGLTINAKMRIQNRSEKTLLIVKPDFYEQAGIKLFSIGAPESAEPIGFYSSPYPTSSNLDQEKSELARQLDAQAPPEKFIVKLNAKQSYFWDEEIFALFDESDSFVELGLNHTWSGLRRKGNQFWVTYLYDLPFEINHLKPGLIEKLPKRWKKYGSFPILCIANADNNCQKKSFSIRVKPIFIDLSRVNIAESKN